MSYFIPFRWRMGVGRTAGGAVAADLAQIVQHPLVESAAAPAPGENPRSTCWVYRVEDLGAPPAPPGGPGQ